MSKQIYPIYQDYLPCMMIQLQPHIRQSLYVRSSSHVTRTGRAYQEAHLVFVHLRCAPCPPYAPPQQDLRYTLNPVYSHPYVTEAASRQCQLFLYFNSSQETYTHRAWDKGIGTCWIRREGWMGYRIQGDNLLSKCWCRGQLHVSQTCQ